MDLGGGVFGRLFRRRCENGCVKADLNAFRGHILLPKELANETVVGSCIGVQMALVGLVLGAGMAVTVCRELVVMVKRRNQHCRQDYRQHQKGRYALFQQHPYPLKVYPAFSTAARISSSFAGPLMVRRF